jgi:hypothetical protein
MSTLTALQQSFINIMVAEGSASETVIEAINSGNLFAEAIDTVFGGISTGSMSLNENPDVPALALTKESILADIKEGQENYADQIEEGERDDDDEYEGELLRVFWDENDMLWFFTPESTGVDTSLAQSSQTVLAAMGQ